MRNNLRSDFGVITCNVLIDYCTPYANLNRCMVLLHSLKQAENVKEVDLLFMMMPNFLRACTSIRKKYNYLLQYF